MQMDLLLLVERAPARGRPPRSPSCPRRHPRRRQQPTADRVRHRRRGRDDMHRLDGARRAAAATVRRVGRVQPMGERQVERGLDGRSARIVDQERTEFRSTARKKYPLGVAQPPAPAASRRELRHRARFDLAGPAACSIARSMSPSALNRAAPAPHPPRVAAVDLRPVFRQLSAKIGSPPCRAAPASKRRRRKSRPPPASSRRRSRAELPGRRAPLPAARDVELTGSIACSRQRALLVFSSLCHRRGLSSPSHCGVARARARRIASLDYSCPAQAVGDLSTAASNLVRFLQAGGCPRVRHHTTRVRDQRRRAAWPDRLCRARWRRRHRSG